MSSVQKDVQSRSVPDIISLIDTVNQCFLKGVCGSEDAKLVVILFARSEADRI